VRREAQKEATAGTAAPPPIRDQTIDFDQAIGTHSKWKRQLRRSLEQRDGSLHPDEVSLDGNCFLGRWIYGEGARHSALPEYRKLKYEHARFHVVASELVRKANSGESVCEQTAPCANSEFSISSSAVVIAILAIKKRLSDEC
jgi:hypothetical protein